MGLMVDQVPVKWWDAGKALEEGSRARLYSAESQKINDLAAGENAARPDLPAAIGGDAAAIGRVAQASPSMLGKIAPMLQRLDTHNANKLKADADWTVGTAQAILSAPPEQRAGLWAAARADAQKRGIATDLPEQYDENRVKFYRDRAVPVKTWFEEQEQMRRHVTPGARAAGGDGFDPLPGAPAAATPGPRADAGPLPGAPPPNQVAQAPAEPAQGSPAAPPPVQQAATPPLGPQGNPILSLPGRASASVGADMPTFAVPPGPFPASGAPSPGPVPQEGGAGPAAGPPPGFQAMGHRTPDGQLVPALINGQPVFRNPQTGEMTLGGGNAPAPAAAPDIQLAQATPPQGRAPAAPSGPPAGPSTNLPAGAAGVEGLPPGWVQRTKNGVPVIKDGYFYATNPQTGQTVPYKPTERPLPPVGYENDPTRPGAHRFIVGGPADPEVIKAQAEVRKTASEKAIPQTITKAMQENLDGVKQIDRVLTLLNATPKGVGNYADYIQRISPEWGGDLNNKVLNPEGTDLRALIADIGSLRLHERSGAAVTASETPRLVPFIPKITDDPGTIRKKLGNFRNVYEQTLRDTADYYGSDNGFKPYKPALDYLDNGQPAPKGAAEKARDSFNEQKATPAGRPPLETFQK